MPTQPDNEFCTTLPMLAMLAFCCFLAGAGAIAVMILWRDWLEMLRKFLEPENKEENEKR